MDVHPWMDKVENSCPKNHAPERERDRDRERRESERGSYSA